MIKKKWSSVWVLSLVFGCVFLLVQIRSNYQGLDRSEGGIEFEVKRPLGNKSAQPPMAASLEKTMLDAVTTTSRKIESNRPQVTGNRRIAGPAGESTQDIDLSRLVLDVSKSGIERRLESEIAQDATAEDHIGSPIPIVLVNDNPVVPDESKRVIESGVMAELNSVTAAGVNVQEQFANRKNESDSRQDVSKFRIETTTKDAIVASQHYVKNPLPPIQNLGRRPNLQSWKGSAQPTANPVEPTDTAANPQVEPGKIKWHEDFDAACLASELSGKPVLHFQLLGELDQRFT